MDDELVKQFIVNACAVRTANKWNDIVSDTAFWHFVTTVLGHGIVQYAEERDVYRSPEGNVAGHYGNMLLRNLHTFEKWKRAKQMFCLPLKPQCILIIKSAELVTPARFAYFPFIYTKTIRNNSKYYYN